MTDPIDLNEEQLACLASPSRNEVFVGLRAMKSASVRELAEKLGRSPESMHYHVRALVKAGLVREALRRPTERRPEAVYETAAESYRLPNLREQPELAPVTLKAVKAGLRHSMRGYEAAAQAAQEHPELRKHLHAIKAVVRLEPGDAQTFLHLIEEAARFAKEHESNDGVRLTWSSIVYPEAKNGI